MKLNISAGGSPEQAVEEVVKQIEIQLGTAGTHEEGIVAESIFAVVHARLAELPSTCSTKVEVQLTIQADRV